MKTGFLALMLLLPAFAAAKTGNDLQVDCSIALKFLDTESVSGEPDFMKIGNCMGFVTGVMQAAALRQADPGNGRSKNNATQFCARPDFSVEQVVRMSLSRLERKPEELDLDAAAVVLRALNEGGEAPCIGDSGKQAEGLHWPDAPKKARLRVRLVAVALALPPSSWGENLEMLVAEKEIGVEEFSLIKLVFTYLPYQPSLSESGFDYSVVHEVSAWRNPDCDETVAELTARSLPDRHEPMIYSHHVPREDLEARHIPLPCYVTKADDYIKSSLEPIPPPPAPPPAVSLVPRHLTREPGGPLLQVRPSAK
jgi:Rap1a immunity proteins